MRASLFGMLLLAFSVHAQMYKCVDERGVTHYSDKPRPNCKGGEVDIRPIPPVSGKVAPRNGDLKAEEREFQRRQIERGRENAAEVKRQEEQKRRCASLRTVLQVLTTARSISTVDAKGERTFIDDAARDAKIAQLKEEIARRCP